jgi:hypothetical protein
MFGEQRLTYPERRTRFNPSRTFPLCQTRTHPVRTHTLLRITVRARLKSDIPVDFIFDPSQTMFGEEWHTYPDSTTRRLKPYRIFPRNTRWFKHSTEESLQEATDYPRSMCGIAQYNPESTRMERSQRKNTRMLWSGKAVAKGPQRFPSICSQDAWLIHSSKWSGAQ